MRITGGYACGRRIATLKGRDIRPTSDRVRESLFQILSVRFQEGWEGKRVLDLFAGSGSLGIEALSRGAEWVLFADCFSGALECIRDNLRRLGRLESAVLARVDLRKRHAAWKRFERHAPFSLVLADPPYNKGLGANALELAANFPLLEPEGVLVLEDASKADMEEEVRGEHATLILEDKRRYGQTTLFFYRVLGEAMPQKR